MMSDSDTDPAAEHEEGFLSRWSRRKHVAKTGVADVEAETALVTEEPVDEPADIEVVEEDLPGDSDMPPLDSLGQDSDYTGFMSPNVSDELRNLALRKLFLGGMFNTRDGLDDYDDDFTSFEKLGDTITADMRHQMAMAKEALEANQASEGIDAEQGGKPSEVLNESAPPGSEMASDAEMEPGVLIVVGEQNDKEISAVNSRRADDNEPHVEDSNAKQDK